MSNLAEHIMKCPRVTEISKLKYEVVSILYLNKDHIVVSTYFGSRGTKRVVAIPDINSIIDSCRVHGTNDIILMHNHPYTRSIRSFFRRECSPEPSRVDMQATERFKDIAAKYGIKLIDHIVISPDETHFSFRDNNLI